MKQLIQSFKTGETILEEVPVPLVRKGHILVKTTRSLVSIGTERMLVEFGKSNLISKARQQPEKVKMVLDKIKSDGLLPTLEAVFNKLEQPIPLGYCQVGRVIEVGEGVSEFKVGDKVATNGSHAEYVCVPINLAALVPENVSDEEAAFTVIASIGLQGIRLLQPTFGETMVVMGLGLIGLLTAEMLVANGCKVIGFDFDAEKLAIASAKGIDAVNLSQVADPVKYVEHATQGVGADGVLITASTKDSSLMSQSARMSRKRGRIILVGVTGLELNRAEFYEKELSFQVSCSYGPGRYDENYEQRGQDYPLPFVRWTEKRNFQAVLQAISSGKLQVKPLISEVIPLENYQEIYGNIGTKKTIASILAYAKDERPISRTIQIGGVSAPLSAGTLGIIGAGNYTKATMLPALKKARAAISHVASNAGVSGTFLARKYGIPNTTTDYKEILANENVSWVAITTRHNLHASMAIEALKAGKHVFVEKPLALTEVELAEVAKTQAETGKAVLVGYNRRFSPFSLKMKQLLSQGEPMNMIATMNAGHIPAESWVQDMQIGGGRIIGEACHMVDLMIFLAESQVVSVHMSAMGLNPESRTDNATLTLKFANGSMGTIHYFANGHKAYSKERVEVYQSGKTLILDNFRKLQGFGFKGFSSMSSKLDKGHNNMFSTLSQLSSGATQLPIAFDEIFNSTITVFKALESLKSGKTMSME